MAKLYRRGKVWWITYYQSGNRKRESLGKDRKVALERYREMVYRLSRKELVESRKIPISLYVKEFLEHVRTRFSPKTHHNYSIALKNLENYLKDEERAKNLSEVDMGMIDRYVSKRLESPSKRRKGMNVDRSTVNTELKAIKRSFNRAVELGYLRDSPARKVRLLGSVRKNPRFFSETEVGLILDDCDDPWAKVIYLMLLYTGLRIGELVYLEWDDIDFENRKIKIRPKDFWKPKGREERIIPMHDVVFYLLLRLERKGRWVFTKRDGGQVNVHSLETKFRRQLEGLGITGANLHTWRHTFASYLIMKSGNIRAVQKLLGHRSIRTTEVYAHLSERHLHHIVGQLPPQKMGTILGTPVVLPGRGIVQVVDNKVVGDTGFEPVTSTV
jgi:integrase